MTSLYSRRHMLLAGGATLVAAGLNTPRGRAAAPASTVLRAETRVLDIQGRAASVLGLRQVNGLTGLTMQAGQDFAVRLENRLSEPTLIHWHGLTPPWRLDGVPGLSQPALAPGQAFDYRFPQHQPGTFWMHSHDGLQEQMLLAAPLIVTDPAEAGLDEQSVVVMLHDFSFTPAVELLRGLQNGGHVMEMSAHASHGGMPADAMGHDPNDVKFDAFLANDRTLDDPEVIAVEPGGWVRLRLINGAAATGFTVDLGETEGSLIAVDGVPVVPMPVRQVPLAIAQRVDIRLRVGRQALPVLFLREAAMERSGIVLAPSGAAINKLADHSHQAGPLVGLDLEQRLQALTPLPARPVDRVLTLGLVGDMAAYRWGLQGAEALQVKAGERVAVTFDNRTPMAHPMHLHGHRFQVMAIDGVPLAGAVRDTVQVPPFSTVTIGFDADNAGLWAFHCHHLYHMAAGMMAVLRYEGVA